MPDYDRLWNEPIEFLSDARTKYGDAVVLREEGPLFSRSAKCAGVIAVFGTENQKTVLSDIETYSLPISATREMNFPEPLINLNRSLHSMQDPEHATHRRLLMGLFSSRNIELRRRLLWQSLEEKTSNWQEGKAGLIALLRELVFHVLTQVLFGSRTETGRVLPGLLKSYFELRRQVTARAAHASDEDRKRLIALGLELDAQLRNFVRERRDNAASESIALMEALASMNSVVGPALQEDEIVGHMNVLFISSTEPIPIALSWFFLVLSQLPALRNQLRQEIAGFGNHKEELVPTGWGKLTLLDRVMQEVLRVLPPNAFMTRITTGPAVLQGITLPAQCEILLSPLLSHRDASLFPHPKSFLPDRWSGIAPSPYAYFPFGAGGHSCIGRSLAIDIMKTVAAYLLPRFEFLLEKDQEIDWSIRIFFAPDPDPQISLLRTKEAKPGVGGQIKGPIRELIDF